MFLKPEDRARALLRTVSDSIKRLELIYNNGKAIRTIFSYEAYGHRLRLKETLQKLMFIDCASYAKRAEELLWRKVFYEPLHLYKLYIKNNDRPDRIADFELSLRMHILSGIGYYQSLLLQIQSETSYTTGPSLCSWLSTAFHIPLYNDDIYQFDRRRVLSHLESPNKVAQRCLMYIGDLFRYLVEFGEPCAKTLAYGYYSAALDVDPAIGLTHNQLGILDIGRCYGLNAIFHYLLCLGARVPFDGARRNLITVLTKNEVRYRKLFGEKPVYGVYLRHPYKYRPKDFRKTITKFIFIMQQFLKPFRSDWDHELPRVFHDALVEFHLMLSTHGDLMLEPLVQSDPGAHVTRADPEDGLAEHVTRTEDYSLYSEQLTGPIFVRIIMIALLTANLVQSETTTATASAQPIETNSPHSAAPAEHGSSDKKGDVLNDKTESEIPVGTESMETDGAQSRPDHSQPESAPSTGQPVSDHPTMDPHGPLSFLLQLSQLYVEHVTRQLRDLLHAGRPRAPRYLTSSRRDRTSKSATAESADQGTAIESSTRADLDSDSKSAAGSDGRELPLSDQHAIDDDEAEEEEEDALGQRDNIEEEEEVGEDVEEAVRDASSDDHDYRPRRLRFARAMLSSSSDEESERMFGERGMDGESDDDAEEEEDEDEDDELSAELWSSDDSSLLHSQDESASPGHSSSEDGESFPDRRLRRVPRLSNSALTESSRRGHLNVCSRSRVTTEPNAVGFASKTNSDRSVLSNENDRCAGNDLPGSLDPITEEESAAEEMRSTHRFRSATNKKRNQATTTPPAESDASEESDHFSGKRTTGGGPRYSRRIASSRNDSHTRDDDDDDDHGRADPIDQAPESDYSTEPDMHVRAKAVSRLYLLPTIKLVLDWIDNAMQHHPNLVTPVFAYPCVADPDQPTKSAATLDPGVGVTQDWCAQLAHLLNELHPLVAQVEQELTGEALLQSSDNAVFDESIVHGKSACANPVSGLLSPFGKYALLRCFRNSRRDDSNVKPKSTEEPVDDQTTDEPSAKDSTESVGHPAVQNEDDDQQQQHQQYALPEDWLLRGLASLTEKHNRIKFTNSTILPAFSRVDEAILRSFHIVSFGHKFAEHSTHLPVQFTEDLTDQKPFHAPARSPQPYASRPFYGHPHPVHGPVWSHPHRRGRGRPAYRHHQHHHSMHYSGRGDYPSRWSTGRGHWTVSYSRSGRGSVHRGCYPGHRSSKPTRAPLADRSRPDERSSAAKRGFLGESLKSEQSESTDSPQRGPESDNLAKQWSNSSLPLSDTHGEYNKPDAEGPTGAEVNPSTADSDSRKTQLMRDMARLRLLNEVDQLARRCHNASPHAPSAGNTTTTTTSTTSAAAADGTGSDSALAPTPMPANFVSPYVVLDAYCLASHLASVRQLVNSGAFVLIIPVAVVAHLDYLKKTMATARVAIRYLEQETQGGNRYLRLQKPEEQLEEPFQLPRLVFPRNPTSGGAETEVVDEPPPGETGLIANPRVVRRWLSILDCAVFFSQLKTPGEPPAVPSVTDDSLAPENKPVTSVTTSATVPETSTDSPRARTTPRDGTPGTLINCPASCCDLLSLSAHTSRDASPDHDRRTALVTVLIGSRDTVPEDTIVPREFLNLIRRTGVRLELLRDFVQRWQKSRRSQTTRFHVDR